MAHPVTWFQISAPDAKPLIPFYKRVFGWRMQPSPGQADFQIIDKESDGIAGGLGASANGLSNVTVYVTCDDVAAQLRKIEAAGGKTAMAPMELPGNMGVIGGFHDPAGNWVGLWAQGSGNEPTPAKQAPVKKAPAKKEPAKKEPAKKAPARKASAKKAPARKAPAKKAPAKKAPAKKAPAKKAPAKKAPARKAPAKRAPAKGPTKKAPARKAPAKRGPAKKAPAKRASAKKRRR